MKKLGYSALVFMGLLAICPNAIQAEATKNRSLEDLRGLVQCDLLANTWFLVSVGNAYQKNIYTSKDIQGMIEEIQRERLILSVDAFRKAGLSTSKGEQIIASEYEKCFKRLLAVDQSFEKELSSGQEKDLTNSESLLRQFNTDVNSWNLKKREQRRKRLLLSSGHWIGRPFPAQ